MIIQSHLCESNEKLIPGLGIRLFTAADYESYQSIYTDAQMMTFVGKPLTADKALELFGQVLKAHESSLPRQLTYAIVNTKSAEVMGLVGLIWIDPNDRSTVEVGVMVLPQWRRQRVAHRAKQMMIECAFQHYAIKVIYAFCNNNNLAANLANQRLGFEAVTMPSVKEKSNAQAWMMSLRNWHNLVS